MTETQPEREAQPQEIKKFEPKNESGSFRDLLEQHLGEVFLIANPESFEETGLGHKIQAGWYKAKPIGQGLAFSGFGSLHSGLPLFPHGS